MSGAFDATQPVDCIHIPVGKTSLYTCAEREFESNRPAATRMFKDEHAGALAGPGGRSLLKTMQDLHQGTRSDAIASSIVARTMFLDAVVEAAVKEDQVSQVVVVAAGMDTRAYRLALPEHVHLWELDFAEVLEYKATALGSTAVPTCKYTPLGLDLTQESWTNELIGAGFDPNLPSCFTVEGLLIYLTPSDTDALLGALAALMCDGSMLAGDWMSEAYLTSALTAPFRNVFSSFDSPFATGSDTVVAVLARHGLYAHAFPLGGDRITQDCARLSPNQLRVARCSSTRKDGCFPFPHLPRHFLFCGEKLRPKQPTEESVASRFLCATEDQPVTDLPVQTLSFSDGANNGTSDLAHVIASRATSLLGLSTALGTDAQLWDLGFDSLLGLQLALELNNLLERAAQRDAGEAVFMHGTPADIAAALSAL